MTAAQTHGWRQPLGNYTGFNKSSSFLRPTGRGAEQEPFLSATLARALSCRLSRGVFVECVPRASHVGVIAGYLLFRAMSCCRLSDALFAIDFVVSSLEAGTNVHKTASSKEKKTVPLPLVALGKVFRSDSWAKKWFSLRQACVPKSIRFVLPAYAEQSGRWLNRAMTTAEGILWMQDIMSWKCTTGGSLTTHSLKATLLKWATMSNSMDMQQRRILSHHVDPGSSSPLTYGRENVAATQVQVAAMLQRIKAGRFDPDETRVAFVDRQIASFCAEIDKSDEHLQYGDLDAVDASDVEDADEAEAGSAENFLARGRFR